MPHAMKASKLFEMSVYLETEHEGTLGAAMTQGSEGGDDELWILKAERFCEWKFENVKGFGKDGRVCKSVSSNAPSNERGTMIALTGILAGDGGDPTDIDTPCEKCWFA